MKKSRLLGTVCACLLSITVSPAVASVVYAYTGNLFNSFTDPSSYDTSMSVTGTLTLAAPLDANLSQSVVMPSSFSFNDGINTITDDFATHSFFEFSTDQAGEITSWVVLLRQGSLVGAGEIEDEIFSRWVTGPVGQDDGNILTCDEFDEEFFDCTVVSFDTGASITQPGVWTVVPAPAALWLFGSGLLGLVGISRRKMAT